MAFIYFPTFDPDIITMFLYSMKIKFVVNISYEL